jgi:hypothetical protein
LPRSIDAGCEDWDVPPTVDPVALGHPARTLSPEECAALARAAAEEVELAALDRSGPGSAVRLWLTDHSEAWLNTWWEPRDSGYHDHDGSNGGVYVIEGSATSEGLRVGAARSPRAVSAGGTFSFGGDEIHRVDHHRGAITIHVYSPPLRSIGHYEVVDGELRRTPGAPDEPSPPSKALTALLA